jgi:predicted small integral membrane protein
MKHQVKHQGMIVNLRSVTCVKKGIEYTGWQVLDYSGGTSTDCPSRPARCCVHPCEALGLPRARSWLSPPLIGKGVFGALTIMKADPAPSASADPSDKQAISAARPSLGCWLVFAAAIFVSVCIHELGHCAIVWLRGYPAIPTPAKEYILKPLPEGVQNQMALGGIMGSVIALVAASVWVHRRPGAISSSILAGAMTAPGFYTLRFILAGRGHDGTEFQEAQAALGLSYAGHVVDWLFASLVVAATVFWFWRTRARPTPKLVVRLVVGAIAALVMLALLQSINNRVFDPIFERNPSHDRPASGAALGNVAS